MAGDWIKFEVSTLDKQEVSLLADVLGIDHDAVIGKLLRVWAWADQNVTIESNGESNGDSVTVSVTTSFLDRLTFCPGFSKALESVGWLVIGERQVVLPNFARHNGKTAKERALAAKRAAKFKGKSNDKGNGSSVTSSVTSALPKEEKREILKEGSEKTLPISLPDWLPAELWADWHAYRNTRKGWTAKAKELSLKTLTELHGQGHSPKTIIERSIERGWTGLFAPAAQNGQQPAFSGPQKTRKELGA
jgi:hypothetical protein